MVWVPRLGFNQYCEGKWLPLQDEFTPSVNSQKNFLRKLWSNFEKSKNQIFSKTTQPILMAKIYVIEGTKEVLKKNREPLPLITRGWKKLLNFLNNFFNMNYFLKTRHFFPISCSHLKLQYIFFRKLSERYFLVKKNKNFFGPYNVWNSIT